MAARKRAEVRIYIYERRIIMFIMPTRFWDKEYVEEVTENLIMPDIGPEGYDDRIDFLNLLSSAVEHEDENKLLLETLQKKYPKETEKYKETVKDENSFKELREKLEEGYRYGT